MRFRRSRRQASCPSEVPLADGTPGTPDTPNTLGTPGTAPAGSIAISRGSMDMLFQLHARIENAIRQIDEKIHRIEQERIQEHEAHRYRVIALHGRLHKVPAEPRDG